MIEEATWLRAKHVKVDSSELKDLLHSRTNDVEQLTKNQAQLYNVDKSKINELSSALSALRQALREETQILDCKSNEFSKCQDYLEQLEAEKRKSLHEVKQLEMKRNSLRNAKPSSQDQQLLEHGKKKLRLYKDLTKIHWDYEATRHSIKGYVSNKRDYIRHFCHENQQINDELIDSLWHEIYLSTDGATKDKDENLEPNIPTDINLSD